MISDEEKEKHYKKVNVFRVVDIPKTYDMEIIRGDKMQKDGGYRTGIYVEGNEKIVSKVPDFNGNYEFSAIFRVYIIPIIPILRLPIWIIGMRRD